MKRFKLIIHGMLLAIVLLMTAPAVAADDWTQDRPPVTIVTNGWVGVRDIDFLEVHDCFTIAELCCLEEMGFYEAGQAGPATLAGETALGGKLPVNPSGGLKSKGHPVGATGVGQLVEVYDQLCGRCGDRQVQGAKLGLAQNMGGSGGSCVVHILEVK